MIKIGRRGGLEPEAGCVKKLLLGRRTPSFPADGTSSVQNRESQSLIIAGKQAGRCARMPLEGWAPEQRQNSLSFCIICFPVSLQTCDGTYPWVPF